VGESSQIVLTRLKKRAQFLHVRHGCKAVRPNVIVEARLGAPGLNAIGVGFTASKKVGGAVVRNRARRRLKEAARQILPQHGLPGADYVLVARASTADAPWASLLDDVGNALIRLRADLQKAPKLGAGKSRPSSDTTSESD
jgi:ribonuclease P protein component